MGRIDVLKTYKIFVDGKFPRTESGRYFAVNNSKGKLLANICLSSRKDFRNAVSAARKSQISWANTTALNKGQILYRIAEMLEGRKEQFVAELMWTGSSKSNAKKEVEMAIDRLIYYAGWSDKFEQIFSTVNPVASSHFNFSVLQPVGVVSVVTTDVFPLLGLVSSLAPIIVGGNTCIILVSEVNPMVGISFAEVLQSSDVPSGVVNILTGKRSELLPHFSSHKDVNAIVFCSSDEDQIRLVEELAVENLKRVQIIRDNKWDRQEGQSPYHIESCMEVKTIWHPTKV